ncbi:MAG: hypothetical protein ACYDG4_10590 [Desulfuromonadaceae bacterium]
MGQIAFEHEVYERLQGKRHLQPIFSGGCYDMGRRLRDYDPGMFIVFNTKRQQLEVHTLSNRGNTFAVNVPDNRLDGRLEEKVRCGDIRTRGMQVFRDIEKHNEKLERSKEQSRKNDLKGVAEEMYPYFKQAGWEGV